MPSVSFASSSTVSDVVDEGLNTVQSPAASTGASFHAAMRNGKFHGTICPTTPMGSCSTSDIMLPGSRSASPVSASRHAGEVAEVVDRVRHVDGARLADGLAVVERLEQRELLGVLLDDVGDLVQNDGARRPCRYCSRTRTPPTPHRRRRPRLPWRRRRWWRASRRWPGRTRRASRRRRRQPTCRRCRAGRTAEPGFPCVHPFLPARRLPTAPQRERPEGALRRGSHGESRGGSRSLQAAAGASQSCVTRAPAGRPKPHGRHRGVSLTVAVSIRACAAPVSRHPAKTCQRLQNVTNAGAVGNPAKARPPPCGRKPRRLPGRASGPGRPAAPPRVGRRPRKPARNACRTPPPIGRYSPTINGLKHSLRNVPFTLLPNYLKNRFQFETIWSVLRRGNARA